MIEVLATVILRCFDKDAQEELYFVNLLRFDSQDLDKWKGSVAHWELALKNTLPKNLKDLEPVQYTSKQAVI